VRKIIYTHALTYTHPIQLQKRNYHRFQRIGYKVSRALCTNFNYTPPLLRSCIQIQDEATSIFFCRNVFRIDVADGDLTDLIEWLNDTPAAYASLVRGLEIHIEPSCVAQVVELAERSSDRKDLWRQAAAFADGIASAGVEVERVRCVVGECKLVGGDVDGVQPAFAMQVAERWVQGLIEVLEDIEALEDEGDVDRLVDGVKSMEIADEDIGIAR
jgi:hypothetical protein